MLEKWNLAFINSFDISAFKCHFDTKEFDAQRRRFNVRRIKFNNFFDDISNLFTTFRLCWQQFELVNDNSNLKTTFQTCWRRFELMTTFQTWNFRRSRLFFGPSRRSDRSRPPTDSSSTELSGLDEDLPKSQIGNLESFLLLIELLLCNYANSNKQLISNWIKSI